MLINANYAKISCLIALLAVMKHTAPNAISLIMLAQIISNV